MTRGRRPKCLYCGSASTISKGHRKTVTLGLRPLRKCKSCGRRFTQKLARPVSSRKKQE